MLAAKAADENRVGLTIGNLLRRNCGISDTVGFCRTAVHYEGLLKQGQQRIVARNQ
jgi:hypothetical protein